MWFIIRQPCTYSFSHPEATPDIINDTHDTANKETSVIDDSDLTQHWVVEIEYLTESILNQALGLLSQVDYSALSRVKYRSQFLRICW